MKSNVSFSNDRERMVSYVDGLYNEALEIIRSKNDDYSISNDALYNFKLASTLLDLPVEQSIFVRLSDKIARLAVLLKKGTENNSVKDETFEDTVKDAMNYLGILAYAIKKKYQKN